MLLTPHTFVGVALAASIPNPFVSVPLSLAMHFLGDLVPHWDFYSNTKREERVVGWRPLAVMADFGLAVAVGMFFTLRAAWVSHNISLALNVFLCAIASVLPDALTGPSIFFANGRLAFLRAVHKLQGKFQFQAPLPWGLLTQIIVISISLVILISSLKL